MLDKNALKQGILSVYADSDKADNVEQSRDIIATGLADLWDSYIKSATISANPAAVTAATMSNGGGPVVADNNLTSTIS